MCGVHSHGLPVPAQLAALGCVLCLYPRTAGGPLQGWQQACQVRQHCALDSDGLDEALLFFDAHDHCCWRLQLLPDADFVAWDRLCSGLAACPQRDALPGACERWRRRMCARLLGQRWMGNLLRFHAIADADSGRPALAASLGSASPLGMQLATRVMRAHGIDPQTSPEPFFHASPMSRAAGPQPMESIR